MSLFTQEPQECQQAQQPQQPKRKERIVYDVTREENRLELIKLLNEKGYDTPDKKRKLFKKIFGDEDIMTITMTPKEMEEAIRWLGGE